jgi:hypothetical protein
VHLSERGAQVVAGAFARLIGEARSAKEVGLSHRSRRRARGTGKVR